MTKFKYDIAISLCKQDVEFAKQLIANINPNLKVFFYEYRQEEILTQSGPEVFGNVFRSESRIVVILSRKEWSKSYYTEIEKNSILDRTTTGYNFLVVIPMEPEGLPPWYPSTRIYLSPNRFTADEIAKFLEFKVTDEGGTVTPVTLDVIYEHLKQKINAKKAITKIQETQDAINAAKVAVAEIKSIFNEKIEILKAVEFTRISYSEFTGNRLSAFFQIGSFELECVISDPEDEGLRIATTQDYHVTLKLSEVFENNDEKQIEIETYNFLFTEMVRGWCIPFLEKPVSNNDLFVLFRNRNNKRFYDLKNPISSHDLIDAHFQAVFKYSSFDLEKLL